MDIGPRLTSRIRVSVWRLCFLFSRRFAVKRSRRTRRSLPDLPADFLLDHGQIFERHPERKQVLAERLKNFAAEQDLPICVVVYAGLIDSTLSCRALLLFDKWIGPRSSWGHSPSGLGSPCSGSSLIVVCAGPTREQWSASVFLK